VAVAVIVGGLETLNLIGDQFGLTESDGFWGAVGALNDNFGVLGYIVGIFFVAWPVSFVVYRLKRYDEIGMVAP
jgi:high-affinity nickel-transport protein